MKSTYGLLRERLAAWLCEPMQVQIDQLREDFEILIYDCSKRFSEYENLISSVPHVQSPDPVTENQHHITWNN